MKGSILWCAFVETRRKRFESAAMFALSLLSAVTLFLVLAAARCLAVPEFLSFERYFSVLAAAVIAVDAAALLTAAFSFAQARRREIGLFRIHGAGKTDILFLSALQVLIVSAGGSVCGVLAGLFAVGAGGLDLLSLLGGERGIRLAGTAGQIAFGVPLIEIVAVSAFTGRSLRQADADLLRGSR